MILGLANDSFYGYESVIKNIPSLEKEGSLHYHLSDEICSLRACPRAPDAPSASDSDSDPGSDEPNNEESHQHYGDSEQGDGASERAGPGDGNGEHTIRVPASQAAGVHLVSGLALLDDLRLTWYYPDLSSFIAESSFLKLTA